jgi:hypothetical protein
VSIGQLPLAVSIGQLPLVVLTLVLAGTGAHPLTTDLACPASCDDLGRCMPLRFVWGVQKGGSTR